MTILNFPNSAGAKFKPLEDADDLLGALDFSVDRLDAIADQEETGRPRILWVYGIAALLLLAITVVWP